MRCGVEARMLGEAAGLMAGWEGMPMPLETEQLGAGDMMGVVYHFCPMAACSSRGDQQDMGMA